MRPTLVIRHGNIKEGAVAGALEEETMVSKRLRRITIDPKTLPFGIIVVAIHIAHPVIGTLDSEVITGING